MAVQVDVFGSCVSRDLFRYVQYGKYKVHKSFGNIPISTLYDFPVHWEHIEELELSNYNQVMLQVQMNKTLPEKLLKDHSNILVIDLADELMKRYYIDDEKKSSLALDDLYENNLMGGDSNISSFYPWDMDLQTIEETYKQFSNKILYGTENPEGYLCSHVIVIEAYYAENILGNDGNLHKHDSKYDIKESNEWLKKIYSIFYKYFPECKVIKLPEFTHSTENHLRGIHPLHYTEDTYHYFEKALDVVCGYSQMNTLENIYKEQSLKNRLATRAARSSVIYQIDGLDKKIKDIEAIIPKPIVVDIFGSCVSRDIFRYMQNNRYKVNLNIQRNPITCLYQEPIQIDMIPENWQERLFSILVNQTAIKQLKNSSADYLIIDLADERLQRWEVEYENSSEVLVSWSKLSENLILNSGFRVREKYFPFDMKEEFIRYKYKKFVDDIVKSEKNQNGYPEENIIVLEAYYAEKIVDNKGRLRNYGVDFKVTEHNKFLNKLYSILYEYMPRCKKIKFPQYTYATMNHMWGVHPLHYTEDTYLYFAREMNTISGVSMINSQLNLYNEQVLKNKYLTRLLNSEVIYGISKMKDDLQKIQKQIADFYNK